MSVISIHSVPRSGSSWLLSIFNSHPETKCVYQPLFSYAFKNVLTNNSSKDEYSMFIQQLKTTQDDFCTMKSNFHTNNGKNPLLTFKKNKNISHLIMKHVTHHYLIKQIIHWNSNIKIIGLVRDPIHVIESQMKASHEKMTDWLNGNDKNNNLEEHFFGFNKWTETNNMFIQLKEKYPNNVYIIHYDMLLDQPQNEIEKMFRFCNLTMTKSTTEFIQQSTQQTNNYDYSVYRNVNDKKCKKSTLPIEIQNYIQTH